MNATEETIFGQAIEKPDPAERVAYLEQACKGDAPLRCRVEKLLSAYGDGAFLEEPVAGLAATTHQELRDSPGKLIGPYKLLQVIGEGGMGVVYMAEQLQPVERKVALKIIKPGMDSRQVIARFEAERQALALMDHPSVAKVLDAGTTDGGRPYFVMELIKGVPITKYCDGNHLSLKERLELMIPVCQAIQHAHQKGIIHRDIKPTNVLVAQYDGRPVPKVIDFGIAKATAQKLTERTMFTEFGQLVGTLEYMSPEQAELNQLDIDTRSDVYSLGVLLYELLTGSTPFDKQKLRTAAFQEMLRIIREDEPPKPSTKLSTIDTLASVAANRSVEPSRLTRSLRGELDWIVMKALDKDRSRRYETAKGLADDLRCFLGGQLVQACPPSLGYRFQKFARRNKVALTTAALVALALIAGTAVSTFQAVRATRAELQARAEEQKAIQATKAEAVARATAEQQASQLRAQQGLLENNQRVNAAVIDELIARSPNDSTGKAGRRSPFAKLNSRDRTEAYRRMGELFTSSKKYPEALAALNSGLELDPLNCGLHLSKGDAHFGQGDYELAVTAYSAAADNQPLSDRSPSPLVKRGFAFCRLSRFDQAIADFRAASARTPDRALKEIEAGFSGQATVSALPDERLRDEMLRLVDHTSAAGTLASRAALLFSFGWFERARAEYVTMRLPSESSVIPNCCVAVCAAAENNLPAYHEGCRALLQENAGRTDSRLATYTLWACALLPDACDDYGPLIKLGGSVVSKSPTTGSESLALGAILLRAKKYQDARKYLVVGSTKGESLSLPSSSAHYLLAMLDHHQGRRAEAHQRLAKAHKLSEVQLNQPSSPHRRISLQLLRKEAVALIDTGAELTATPDQVE